MANMLYGESFYGALYYGGSEPPPQPPWVIRTPSLELSIEGRVPGMIVGGRFYATKGEINHLLDKSVKPRRATLSTGRRITIYRLMDNRVIAVIGKKALVGSEIAEIEAAFDDFP